MTRDALLFEALRLIDAEPAFSGLYDEDTLRRCRIVAQRLAAGKQRPFRVVFCGVFSSGKTSLINALLDAPYQFPQGVNPVTKLVTRICGGEEVACGYRLGGRRVPVPKEYITALIRGQKELISGSTELIIDVPSAMLQDRVEILDTPGFNDEMGGSLEQMTRDAIDEADMAVMCCNALQLGKILERDLLGELDERMGHYCLALTRMDNLNSPEDREDVTNRAAELMRGRGNDAGVFGGGHAFVFPVTAVGMYKDTSALANYCKAVWCDGGVKRQIREVSDEKVLNLCIESLRPPLEELHEQLSVQLAGLNERNRASVRRQELDAKAKRSSGEIARQQAARMAQQMAQQRMNGFSASVRTLQNPATFSIHADQMTNGMINDLINDIARYSDVQQIANGADVKNMLCREYFTYGYATPLPERTRVKKRKHFSRALRTVWNLLRFRFEIDDGYEEVWADYHEPAIQAVWSGPVTRVLRKWEDYLAQTNESVPTVGFTGGHEREMELTRELLQQCGRVLDILRK